jgi:Na+/phosphate symporter
MINDISDYLLSFKNKNLEAQDIQENCNTKITEYANTLKENNLNNHYEENFYAILGYSYRLKEVKQRLFYTFQEAIYAINLDRLMKNDDSSKDNTIVYTLVLDTILQEYTSSIVNHEEKKTALEIYKKIQDKQAKENSKYHVYQN